MDAQDNLMQEAAPTEKLGSSAPMDDWLSRFYEVEEQYRDVLQMLRRHEIPESYAAFCTDARNPTNLEIPSGILRPSFLEVSGFALVAYDWVRPLAKWIGDRRCLEVMCGSGCLAKALQNCGVDVIATDDFSWENHDSCWFQNPWTPIEQMSAADAVRKYGWTTDIVLISWPYRDGAAYEVLLEMRKQNRNAQMIFIGEWNRSCADSAFFQAANPVCDASFQDAVACFRRHALIYDLPYLLK